MCRQPKSACVLSVLVLLGLGAVDASHGAAILLTDGREISALQTYILSTTTGKKF